METNNCKSPFLSSILVKGLWNRNDLVWDHIDQEVSILIGPNGSGKSTSLRMIYRVLNRSTKDFDKIGKDIHLTFTDGSVVSYASKKLKFSGADGEFPHLNLEYINSLDLLTSKFDYPKPEIHYPESRIASLFEQVDRFLQPTGKKIGINSETNKLCFRFAGRKEEIGPEKLSSGEKQLLIILFKVFRQQEQPFILLMDEPELSLHIEWQMNIISAMRILNPNCQIILSTHSPSIFADGWSDKLVFMEDIVQPAKEER